RKKRPVADETYRIYERIAETKVLPPKSRLHFWTQWLGSDPNDKFEYRVWNIGLNVSTGENTGHGLAIRHLVLDRRIALRPSPRHSWIIDPRPPLPAGESTLVWNG